MLTIEKLKEFGADTEEGLSRCMGNRDLYLRLVSKVADHPDFELIGERISCHDLSGAFESAHALKGVLGNLSLTPLYDKVCEITELLRNQSEGDYRVLLDQMSALRTELKEFIG